MTQTLPVDPGPPAGETTTQTFLLDRSKGLYLDRSTLAGQTPGVDLPQVDLDRSTPEVYLDRSKGLGGVDQTARVDQTAPETSAPTTEPADPGLGLTDGLETGLETETTETQTKTKKTKKKKTKTSKVAAAAGAAHSWLGRGGYLIAVTVVIGFVAALGQKAFAVKVKFTNMVTVNGYDLTPWFAPFVFDFLVAALMHGGLRAARNRHSPWKWWAGASIVGGLSVATNFAHEGGAITGPASIGLCIAWGLYLYDEYRSIRRSREIEDANAEDFTGTDILFVVDRELAELTHDIVRAESMEMAKRYRHGLGETALTRRNVGIGAAKLFREVRNDTYQYELTAKKVKPWQVGKRKAAKRLAHVTAADARDQYLGLPVPDRQITVRRTTFQDHNPGSTHAALKVQNAQLNVASAAAPAAPSQLPTPPAQPQIEAPAPGAPAARAARPVSAPPARPRPVVRTEPVVLEAVVRRPGQPSGSAGANWLPLEEIPGAPAYLPADLVCECHPSDPGKWCRNTLAVHTERVGQYIAKVAEVHQDWLTREPHVSAGRIMEVCNLPGKATALKVMYVMNQLRAHAAGKPVDQAAADMGSDDQDGADDL